VRSDETTRFLKCVKTAKSKDFDDYPSSQEEEMEEEDPTSSKYNTGT
jgi:hypothetical protein